MNMATEPRQDKSIFSERMHRIGNTIYQNVREDLEPLFWIFTMIYAFFTCVLLFWWKQMGYMGMVAYQQYWSVTYPLLPISESYSWQFMLWADKLTELFLLGTWLLILLFVIFLSIPKNPKYGLVNPEKEKPLVQIIDKNNESKFFTFEQAMKYMDNIGYSKEDITTITKPKINKKPMKKDVCPNCGSSKIRIAGKRHPGKIYCKSCREFY